jgi:hypothetical protein
MSSALGLIGLRLAALGLDQAPRTDLVRVAEEVSARLTFLAVGDSARAAARGSASLADGVPVSEGAGSAGGQEEADVRGSSARPVLGPSARPVLGLRSGAWTVIDWAADTGHGLRSLADRVVALAADAQTALHIGLVGAGADAEVAALATFLEGRALPSELWIAPADRATAAVLGPGGFGVAVYAD